MWITYIIVSAILLSFFDVFRKAAIKDNPIWHVLAISNAFGALYVTLFYVLSGWIGDAVTVTKYQMLLLFVKALINSSEWFLAFYAYRTLPITTYVPIGASSPLWTVIAAMIIFHEIPTPLQGLGMLIIFAGYWFYATSGKTEGFNLFKSRGVIACFASVLLGAGSSIFDKYLLHDAGITSRQILFWFMLNMAAIAVTVVLVKALFRGKLREGAKVVLEWRVFLPLIGLAITVSDFLYFEAVAMPDAMISIVALLRRLNVVFTFVLGVIFFRERNFKSKAISLAMIIAGAIVILLNSRG